MGYVLSSEEGHNGSAWCDQRFVEETVVSRFKILAPFIILRDGLRKMKDGRGQLHAPTALPQGRLSEIYIFIRIRIPDYDTAA
jgi:hypothetical protein